MILTITANPSIDMSYFLEKFIEDGINRTQNISKTAGGKGLNVSKVLKILGDEVIATGFLGGRNGEFIYDELKQREIKSDFVEIKEATRNCIALIYDEKQTEILEAGPQISKSESAALLEKLERIIESDMIVSMSGGLAPGLNTDYYAQITKIVNSKGAKAVLDTSGEALSEVLKSDSLPFMIKPNLEELESFLGKRVGSDTNRVGAILKEGVLGKLPNILVSLGEEGAIARFGNELYRAYTPKVRVVSSVGSGDAAVAGFIHAYSRGLDNVEILKTAMTCGVLNAMQITTGHIALSDFKDIYEKIKVELI